MTESMSAESAEELAMNRQLEEAVKGHREDWADDWRAIWRETVKHGGETRRRFYDAESRLWRAQEALRIAEASVADARAEYDRVRVEYETEGQFVRLAFDTFKTDLDRVHGDPDSA